MTSTFTFVNTVDAPSLSASSAKAMRAHVTKANFAKRRKRIAVEGWRREKQVLAEDPSNQLVTPVEDEAQEQPPVKEQAARSDDSTNHSNAIRQNKQRRRRNGDQSRNENPPQGSIAAETNSLSSLVRPTDPMLRLSCFMRYFAPIKFASGVCPPGQDIWMSLRFSEPAFYEASLAVGVSYRRILWNGQRSAPEGHAGKAISIVNSRLSDPRKAVSDGVLAAVFTLAVWELRAGHEEIWAVHIDGLAKMIALRNSHGGDKLPPWIEDLLRYNSFGLTTQIQKKRYQKVLDALALSGDGCPEVDTSHVSLYMSKLTRALERYRLFGMTPLSIAQEIEEPIRQLYTTAERLGRGNQPLLRASGLAIIIFLRLSWPKPSVVPLSALAHDLRYALEISQFRPCSTIDFAAWQYFIGAVASHPQSEDRMWYVITLARLLRTIPLDNWNEVLALLKRSFLPDVALLARVKEIWEECEAVRGA